jgi:hypothetical protein
MKRLLTVVAISTVFMATLVVGADAQRRRRPRAPRDATPQSAALAGDMDGIQWGWSRQQLLEHFRRKVRARYAPRLSKAPGAIEEDALRAEMERELQRIRESYFAFDGTTSGHDSSFLRFEFTHNNGESMQRMRSENSEDYYFFINDRLWKWYRAFHSSVFAGASFDQFATALEGRYGNARRQSGVLNEGQPETQWLEWQDRRTRARAVDNNQFYGFYCLVFEEKATIARLDQLRPNRPAPRDTGHALVRSVVIDPNQDVEIHDPHSDVVDHITRESSMAPTGRQKTSGTGTR